MIAYKKYNNSSTLSFKHTSRPLTYWTSDSFNKDSSSILKTVRNSSYALAFYWFTKSFPHILGSKIAALYPNINNKIQIIKHTK
jgi:hypothetical protein